MLKVALLQHKNQGNAEANLRYIATQAHEARQQNVQLLVLQELHNGAYFCQHENVDEFNRAESIPGPSTDFLGDLAKSTGLVIVASLFEKRAAGLYHNTAVVIENDGHIAGKYRKMHIPDDPGYYEKFYFTEGDLGFTPIQTSLGKLGVLVCWDQWYPEAARLMAMAGAEMLIYPTAIGWDKNESLEEQTRQRQAWITIQCSHAIANGLPVISCNRSGHEIDPSGQTHGITFWGSSFICGPQGEILSQSLSDTDEMLIADIELMQSENIRRIWPFFRDRRIDTYKDLIKRWQD